MPIAITEHQHDSPRHRCAYLSCGAVDAPLIVLVHGWPERAISWRHQFQFLAERGYRVVAPDMRGYGGSSVYSRHSDYAVEPNVIDLLDLLKSLGRDRAIWIGHDWGSPVVWALASLYPRHCQAVASLCVPYLPDGFTIKSLLPLVDRTLYPIERFPAGQWEYFLHYREQFARAQACMQANVPNTVKALFRRGNPQAQGKPGRLAFARIENGWFGGLPQAPELPMDTAVLDDASFAIYVQGLNQNGFFGPNSSYMNDEANEAYAKRAVNGGRLTLPVLFLHARHDYTCETLTSRLAEPMRAHCAQLTERIIDSGHWMAQEQPVQLNQALGEWLAALR